MEVINIATISVFICKELEDVDKIVRSIDRKKTKSGWFTARKSKYNENEVFIQFWFYEELSESLRKILSEEDVDEVISLLKYNGKTKVLKRIFCFINTLTKTLEVYRGMDALTQEIVSSIERFLRIKFSPLRMDSNQLIRIFTEHGVELKQAFFKNVDGLFYHILRGRNLEKNEKFLKYLERFKEGLRIISFRPNIRFLNSHCRYQITINGDKGTIKLSSNGMFKWRPRFELRQLTFIMANVCNLV